MKTAWPQYNIGVDTETDTVLHTFQLTIARFRFKILCRDASFVERLQARYAPFLSSGEICAGDLGENAQVRPFTIQVQVPNHVSPSPATNKEPTFEAGILRFTKPGFEGYIDSSQRIAQLQLTSVQMAGEFDYFLRTACAVMAFDARGLLFHAAGVVRNGRAFLFFGHSGSGKTTVSRLSTNDLILNDDLVVILPTAGGLEVHGTPFWNPTQVKPNPQNAPLGAMFRLVQDKQIFLEGFSKGRALAEMFSCIPILSADPSRSQTLLAVCTHIFESVPVYRLHFLPNASFWRVVETVAR